MITTDISPTLALNMSLESNNRINVDFDQGFNFNDSQVEITTRIPYLGPTTFPDPLGFVNTSGSDSQNDHLTFKFDTIHKELAVDDYLPYNASLDEDICLEPEWITAMDDSVNFVLETLFEEDET